jgi:hypothetical protein
MQPSNGPTADIDALGLVYQVQALVTAASQLASEKLYSDATGVLNACETILEILEDRVEDLQLLVRRLAATDQPAEVCHG